MKRTVILFSGFGVILGSALSLTFALPQEKLCRWEVYFSPHGGCTDAIIKQLDKAKAKTSILVQAYTFTAAQIPYLL